MGLFGYGLLGALMFLPLGSALAQGGNAAELFEKAPPVVDEALRARVSQFFEAYVQGKYRQADALVAEDSKDAFFAARKPRYRGFEIVRIQYSDEFTKASVLVSADGDFNLPLAGQRLPVKMPVTSLWKFEDREWFWYAPPRGEEKREGAFGTFQAGAGDGKSATPAMPDLQDPEKLLNKVAASKNEILLVSNIRGSDSVEVTNHLPGAIQLSLQGVPMKGLSIALEKTELQAGESTKVTVDWDPTGTGQKPAYTFQIAVEPTSQSIPVAVKFSAPVQVASPAAQ
jgi:hypothetical protein